MCASIGSSESLDDFANKHESFIYIKRKPTNRVRLALGNDARTPKQCLLLLLSILFEKFQYNIKRLSVSFMNVPMMNSEIVLYQSFKNLTYLTIDIWTEDMSESSLYLGAGIFTQLKTFGVD